MNIRRTKEQKGITLIALVVTIIVLIILAGISISLLFGKSGIITRAKKGQEIVDVSTAQEKLELIKSEIPMKILDGKDSTVNLNNYLEELNKEKNKKDCDVTNIEKLNDINAEITISGKYKFIAKDEENGNVKIIYLGEAGGLQISPTEATYRYPTAGTFEVINNESQGKLTVKSSNEEIAKASISGTTVTVTPQKMAGTAKIVVTSEANGKYAEGRVTHTAKVENGTILLDAEPYIAEYDGKAHDALISVTVDPKDCKLEYSLDGGEFTEIMPKVTMAAEEYTISIKASKEGYTTNAITKTVTINKQSNTNGNLTLSATSGTITYPNNGTFTVTKNTSGGTLSVSSSDTSVATASISGTTVTVTPKTPSVNGKQVTITVTSAATSNYEAQTATYVATVNRGTITINATPYNGNYDGKSHPALTAVSTNPTGTTIEYALNGGTYNTTMPQVNSIGKYSISIRATKAGYIKSEKTITIIREKRTSVYAKLYTDGTLIFSSTDYTDSSRTVSENYGDISSDTSPKWVANYGSTNKASNVIIHDKIYPTNTKSWFESYTGTTLDLKNLDTSNVTDMERMFLRCSNLTSIDVSKFDTSKVTDMRCMFDGCSKLTSLNVSNFDTSSLLICASMFSNCSSLTSLNVSNFDTSNVTDMSNMFGRCSKLTSLNVSNFNTSNAYRGMTGMFENCSNLTSIDVSNFDTSKVQNMQYMFSGCNNLTSLNLSNFNTSKVHDIRGMFSGCSNLTSIDLSNFNTSNVNNMSEMFYHCDNLTNLNISNFDTSNVTNMSAMFSYCSKLTSINVSNFNTSNVTDMNGMFAYCQKLTSLNVNNFNTSNVTNMSAMFFGCSNLTKIIVGSKWIINSGTNTNGMFSNCGTQTVTRQ